MGGSFLHWVTPLTLTSFHEGALTGRKSAIYGHHCKPAWDHGGSGRQVDPSCPDPSFLHIGLPCPPKTAWDWDSLWGRQLREVWQEITPPFVKGCG